MQENLQVIWEQLNGLLHDIESQSSPEDMGQTIEDCIQRLEALGVNQENEVTK